MPLAPLFAAFALLQIRPVAPLGVAGRSPAVLHGQTFYLAAELDKLDHHFDPEEWVDGEPMRITFDAPGKLTLQYAQDDDRCAFTASGKRSPYLLTLSCEGKSIASARWIWLGPHRALTSLLSGGRSPELLREVVVPEQPVDLKALDAQFDAAYAAAELPALAGSYQGPQGVRLAIAPDGSATLAGEGIKLALKRCSTDAPQPAPCFVRQPATGEAQVGAPVFLAREEKGRPVLEEGLLGSDVAYCPFEGVPQARKFVRLDGTKAASPGK